MLKGQEPFRLAKWARRKSLWFNRGKFHCLAFDEVNFKFQVSHLTLFFNEFFNKCLVERLLKTLKNQKQKL